MVRFSERRARFNRRVTNRLFRPVSGYLPIWSIVEHTGRRSGRTYRTPVSAFTTPDGVAVLLPYGRQRDWVKNLQSAGGGRVKFEGRTFAVDQPRVVATAEALPQLRAPWRQLMARAGVEHTLLLRRAG
ncbi:nitroreductase family deazaflavin-dependent oxidoreductase [Mycobacterium sp. 48b]|uniref:nitroreductase family deazaflavin-dependent oxidoreductase n=1 Tax=Mycobacterium sp. 48b TaxID=3400426 RepID=UPI003AB06E98